MVLYQDRLYDDGASSTAGCPTRSASSPPSAAIPPASRSSRSATIGSTAPSLGKLLKGLGITLFFVCLILVQNVLSRRAKLRLLDLEAALVGGARGDSLVDAGDAGLRRRRSSGSRSRRRIGSAAPSTTSRARDDGSIDLLLAVPAGTGVDAAFASMVLRDLYRRQGGASDPAARVAALFADYERSPLARDVELLCAHFAADGDVRGVLAGLRAPV